jgi:TctA family transporter
LTIFFSKLVAKRISRINYPLISKITLCLVVGIVVCLSGWKGILVLFSSTCVGILCHLTGVRKGVMICCLIVPTFLFYFPF